MFQCLFGSDPAFRRWGEYLEDEVFGLLRDIGPVVVTQTDIADEGHLLDFLDVVGLEGEVAVDHEVEDDAQAEGVDLVVVLLHLVHLRGDETWCPCVLLPVSQVLQLVLVDTEPKIDQFHPLHHLLVLSHYDLRKDMSTMTFSGLRSRWMIPDSLR